MKNFKKLSLILVISLFIIVLGSCTHTPIETPHDNYTPADKSVQSEDLQMMEIHVDAAYFSNLEEMTDWAHHLIRGFTIDERVDSRNVRLNIPLLLALSFLVGIGCVEAGSHLGKKASQKIALDFSIISGLILIGIAIWNLF